MLEHEKRISPDLDHSTYILNILFISENLWVDVKPYWTTSNISYGTDITVQSEWASSLLLVITKTEMPFRPLFLYFCLFFLNVQLVDKILMMLGFEPLISGVGKDHSTNWATTTALPKCLVKVSSLKPSKYKEEVHVVLLMSVMLSLFSPTFVL